jgi:glycosyltransferase involved in cell wall biosynthesis
MQADFIHRSEKHLVSVVIPTYNRGYVLPKAIKSVLNQTYRRIEVIVVDDGSSDDTGKLIEDLKRCEVFYIRHDSNRGEAAATNTGIRNSRGQFITFLDSDDEMLPEKVARQVKEMELRDTLGACFTKVTQDKGKEENIWTPFSPPRSFCNSSGMYRRKIFSEIGLLDESLELCSDVELAIRICRDCETLNIDEILMRRKRMDDARSLAPDAGAAKYRSYKKIYARYGSFLVKRFGRRYLSDEIHGWGKFLLRKGDISEAKRCFKQALMICPWKMRNYKKLFKAVFMRRGHKHTL